MPPNNPLPSCRGWFTAERSAEFQNLNVREPGESEIASSTSEFGLKARGVWGGAGVLPKAVRYAWTRNGVALAGSWERSVWGG